MNKCKTLVAVMAAMFISTALFAEVDFSQKNTWGRVDVNGVSERVKLTPIKGEFTFLNQNWRKEKDFCLISKIYFKNDVWRKVKLAFTAGSNGKIKLLFLGAYRPKAQVESQGLPWFKYTNIKINGEVVSFDETKWILKDGTGFITAKGPDGNDIKCVKGKCFSPACYELNVKKGQIIKIEFDLKLAK